MDATRVCASSGSGYSAIGATSASSCAAGRVAPGSAAAAGTGPDVTDIGAVEATGAGTMEGIVGAGSGVM